MSTKNLIYKVRLYAIFFYYDNNIINKVNYIVVISNITIILTKLFMLISLLSSNYGKH